MADDSTSTTTSVVELSLLAKLICIVVDLEGLVEMNCGEISVSN